MIQSKDDIERKLGELTLTDRDKSIELLNTILDTIPKEYSTLINEAHKYKRIPKEYLLSSILFAVGASTGLTFYIEALGYRNYGNLYFTIVGSRGDTKSEALKIATNPLTYQDHKSYDKFRNSVKEYNSEVDDEPRRKQILIQNSTIESVHKTHYENPNSIGIYIDEVYTLIEKMGNSNSRDGVEWRTFLLQGYTNAYVDVGRKTSESFRIKETYPNLLGGIQKEFIPKLFANGNLESGFIDRLLLTPSLTNNNKLIRGLISKNVIEDYNTSITNILGYKTQSETKEETIKKFKISLTEEAEDRLFEYTQALIDRKESAGVILKEYNAKMQISIHKLSLILHMMQISKDMDYTKRLEKDTVELAITVNEYYFNNFKIIIDENYKSNHKKASLDEIIRVAIKNGASQTSVVEITKVVKSTVSKHWTRIKKELETGNHHRKPI
jgi:hypothetical protein